jgi:nuclear receptor interaction protein
MEAGTDVNYKFVNNAFGGLRGIEESSDESEEEREQADIDPNAEEERIRHIELVRTGGSDSRQDDASESSQEETNPSHASDDQGEAESDASEAESDGIEAEHESPEEPDYFDADSDTDADADADDWPLNTSSDGDTPDDSDDTSSSGYAIPRVRQENVERDAPCSTHTRSYRGHCNVKTVKDVNFYGLNDEYVVSGSDSGHVFIWDRKTASLVNILEGDSDVVNVVQGK